MAVIHYSNSGGVGPQGPVGAKGDPGESGVGLEVSYTVGGGTLGATQPTFSGTPLFSGNYVGAGALVFFRVNVIMTNITGFGVGQYYMTLPFPAKYDTIVGTGSLKDFSGNDRYAIIGQVDAGTDVLKLWYSGPSGKTLEFDHASPVTLQPQDSFSLSGSYIKAD